ncbi:MAG: ABC transporter permease [Acidobacteria bacterium]|nr:ABC transporter permease [Acidobacteriota bacterium]
MLNIRFALRTLFKSPFVTTIAVVSLAFGIGANTAIFSLFNQMLLKPLPVTAPDRLVNLSAPGPKPGSQSCNQAGDCDAVFSYLMFRDLEQETRVFTGLAAHRAFGANLSYQGQTQNGEGMLVSGSYFPTLGLTPALGRLLGPGDDAVVGESLVAVLSHDYWVTRFGANPGVLNATMTINGHSLTVVGVAPAGFGGTTLGSRPRVFVPITLRGLLENNFDGFDNRRNYWAYVFGRLAPGMTVESARTAMESRYRTIITEVEAPLQTGMSEANMERFRAKPLVIDPGQRGQSSVHTEAGTPLQILFGVTGIVLLIACANIANLLLARAAGRAGEMAVRLSIGASRIQLVGQLLLESCLLALLGGAGGLLVAQWTMGVISQILPADAAEVLTFSVDWTVLSFAAALSLGTGLVFGLFPAIHSTRPDLATTLKGTAGQPSGSRSAARFRTVMVVGQMALSMALLTSAGLFTKSLYNVSRVDLGVDIEQVVTFRVSPRMSGYTPEKSKQLFERLEESLQAQPGVRAVTASLVPLLAGSNWGTDVRVQGFESGPDIDSNSRLNTVAPDYFSTLGIPLIAGREFTTADRLGARKVAIVNEAFADKFKLGRDAVGKLMGESGSSGELDMEIVGLVQNAKYSEVKGAIPPLFFSPYRQDESIGSISFYIRTEIAPEQFLRTIPALVSALDPDLPLEELRTMPQQVRENVFLDRLISTMSASFAILATLLAAIGLYGVLAYTVSQRTREFGLRMALGADGAGVRALVLKQVAVMAAVGGVIGLGLAWWIGREAQSQLFEVQGHDPAIFALSFVLLGVVALTAGFLPALRASRIAPMKALRWE